MTVYGVFSCFYGSNALEGAYSTLEGALTEARARAQEHGCREGGGTEGCAFFARDPATSNYVEVWPIEVR